MESMFNTKVITLGLALSLALSTLGIEKQAQAQSKADTKPDLKAYMSQLQSKIQWSPPQKTTAEKVTVLFTIAKNGQVSAVKVQEPSGDPAADSLAMECIKKSGPFAPLPGGRSTLNVTFTLPCQRGHTASGVDMNPYFAEFSKKIHKTWWVPKRLLFCQVSVKMSIAKDGTVSQLAVTKSSGDKNADRLAIIGIKRASPFAPLPAGVDGPYQMTYTVGFANDHSKDFSIWNGQRVGLGESYETSGGVKVGHIDHTTDKDKAFHLRKEEALIKMADLDEQMDKEIKASGPDSIKLVPLLVQYAVSDRSIEEHLEALSKLKQALAIARKAGAGHDKELAQSLCALGEVEYNLGHTAEAEPLLKEAIELKENVLKAQDKELKELLETYARLLYKQNRIEESEAVAKKARAII